ncbi:rubredoxin [Methanoregula sp.]|uniref:rubredoxin n=1 Tax=Methanoregula sp. TaxID=2052170 RepID=UPI0026323DF2|nr:rubredoxin [Methanoregula sp.]MDD5143430.1 rubredoxin [Methanoregula sp.]
MERFVCTICGHVYDPERGEIRLDLAPGKDFADFPGDYLCPVCFAGKSKFVKAG